jgi:hypothetical protein
MGATLNTMKAANIFVCAIYPQRKQRKSIKKKKYPMSHKPGYENDETYNANIPTLSDETISKIYKSAGISEVTGNRLVMVGKVVNGGETEINASYHDLKAAALACNCISCAGVLENIRNAVMAYHDSQRLYVRRWMRQNRAYFIQRLRDVIASPDANHDEKQGE